MPLLMSGGPKPSWAREIVPAISTHDVQNVPRDSVRFARQNEKAVGD